MRLPIQAGKPLHPLRRKPLFARIPDMGTRMFDPPLLEYKPSRLRWRSRECLVSGASSEGHHGGIRLRTSR